MTDWGSWSPSRVLAIAGLPRTLLLYLCGLAPDVPFRSPRYVRVNLLSGAEEKPGIQPSIASIRKKLRVQVPLPPPRF